MLPVRALATPADASGPRRLSNDPAAKVLGTWDTRWPDCGEDAIVFVWPPTRLRHTGTCG